MAGGARCLSCQSQRFVAHNQNRPLARRHHALGDGAHQSFRETGTAVRAETNRVRIESFRGLRDCLRRVGALNDFRLDFEAVCRVGRDERAQLHSKFRIIFARPRFVFLRGGWGFHHVDEFQCAAAALQNRAAIGDRVVPQFGEISCDEDAIEFRNRHRRSRFERRNNRDAHIAVTQNRPRDRAESQSAQTVAPMSSDDNQIDLLTLRDLKQGAFRMSPARLDRDRHLFRWQSHRDVFRHVALEKVLDLFRIFGQRQRPVKSQSPRLVRRPVDMQHARVAHGPICCS